MKSPFQSSSLLVCFVLTLFFGGSAFAQDKDWRPISPEELSSQKPLVDPDADAEAIFWEVRIDAGSMDLSRWNYVRIKIYTERGREKYSKFDIDFYKGIKIKDLAARVTRPDGSSVEIKKEDIFEREIVKVSGQKLKAKSFAVPNIEPGVIIEYKYKEVYPYSSALGLRLQFQQDIPVQKLSYYYKPHDGEPKYQSYNFTDTKFVKDENGYWLASRTNVPAVKGEPQMPPEDMIRAWMRLTAKSIGFGWAPNQTANFSLRDPSSPSKYWGAVGGDLLPWTKFMNESHGDIKKAAAQITEGAANDDEKLRKLYDFCQKEIANTTWDPAMTDEKRAKLPETTSVSDVLKRKSGSARFINLLFGSLAHASDFETRIAYSGDRSKMFITPDMTNESFIHPAAVAVKVGDGFKYFDPGTRFLPYGMLLWNEEDTWALLIGEKDFMWQQLPFTDYAASVTKRTGKFTLLENGTLEGTVEMELNGQPGLLYRIDKYDEASAQVQDELTQDVKRRISTAEISDVSIENLADTSKPVVQKYKVSIPNYAQRTGKRLFLQPGFFEYGENPVFSSASRKYDLFFQYPWSEEDQIEIEYPKNFDFDSPDAPAAVADASNIGSLNIGIILFKGKHLLKYTRKFHFGGGGHVWFGADMYKPIKGMFDGFHKADSHTITLKQQ